MQVIRATLVDQVEDVVRSDIMSGEFAPGQRLRFADLSARYGVSATPLREALQRLAAQNLIDWDPRLGATVAGVSGPELRDIYWLRDVLESLAIRRALEHADEGWSARVAEAWRVYDLTKRPEHGAPRDVVEAWSVAHRAFHESMFTGVDSPWLLRFIGTLADHSERYRLLSARDTNRDPHKEHEDIFRAAVARDADATVEAMRRHLAATVAGLEASAGGKVRPISAAETAPEDTAATG